MLSREAEDLWWFETSEGVVAFRRPQKVAVEFYYPEDCWMINVDGRTHRVSRWAVEDRRYWFPMFKGAWRNGRWALTAFSGQAGRVGAQKKKAPHGAS